VSGVHQGDTEAERDQQSSSECEATNHGGCLQVQTRYRKSGEGKANRSACVGNHLDAWARIGQAQT
jgi:hypothetical protein